MNDLHQPVVPDLTGVKQFSVLVEVVGFDFFSEVLFYVFVAEWPLVVYWYFLIYRHELHDALVLLIVNLSSIIIKIKHNLV